MLNEILECEEYRKLQKGRLKYYSLQNHMAGLIRAMEVIAADEINKSVKRKDLADKDIELIKKQLINWYNTDFTEYARNISISKTKKSNGENKRNAVREDAIKQLEQSALSEDIKTRGKHMASSLFSSANQVYSDALSNYNKVTAERAIANALVCWGTSGLKRYYLVCDYDLFSKTHLKAEYESGKKTNAFDTVCDTVIKLTSAYLLKKRLMPENSELVINHADIYNWMVKGNQNQYLNEATYFFESETKHIEIFSKPKIGNKKQFLVKYKCSEEWIKHFEIIEEHELNKWLEDNDNSDKHFYSDWGAGEYLKKDVPYQSEQQILSSRN